MSKTIFVFPGQGAQYVGMGKALSESFAPAKELLQKAADSVAVFDFYDKLYDRVLRELAWYSESGYDVMF